MYVFHVGMIGCLLLLSNVLLMSNATVIVRSGGLFWLKPVAMVLFMVCSAVLGFI